MPASILTGWILHQWVAFIEIDQMWLLHVSSLDFLKDFSHILSAILVLALWLMGDSCCDCFPAGCNPTSMTLIGATPIFAGTEGRQQDNSSHVAHLSHNQQQQLELMSR